MELREMERGESYRVAGYGGVAWEFNGPTVMQYLNTEDEYETDETGTADMVMVGDDRVHVIDPSDCTPLAESEYCHECGQIGCTADGREA